MHHLSREGALRGVAHWVATRVALLCALAASAAFAPPARATIVRFETVLGDIDVRMYDTATPQTVANFLGYVTTEAYEDTFFHRSVPGFVVQGGGFRVEDSSVVSIPQNPSVVNEPGISNLRGTIAMAKLGGDSNSATNQWFFSLADNSANLDSQNGGFTVFGRVLGDGMAVADAIAQLQRVNIGKPFDTLPVVNWTFGDPVLISNVVAVPTIRVLDLSEGDYNRDGVVDAADFTVWRDSLGSTTNADADGNGDGVVSELDYAIWRDDYGATGAAAIPEPSAIVLLSMLFLCRVAWHKDALDA